MLIKSKKNSHLAPLTRPHLNQQASLRDLENNPKIFNFYQINGNAGADGSGLINTIPETNFVYHGFNVTYSSRQIYSSSDPTICEVFFYIHSTEVTIVYICNCFCDIYLI